jgi:hypothetical protein
MIARIAKQQNLIDFTLSSLTRHKTRNLGLLLVYSLAVFLLASVMLFTHPLNAALIQRPRGRPPGLRDRTFARRLLSRCLPQDRNTSSTVFVAK